MVCEQKDNGGGGTQVTYAAGDWNVGSLFDTRGFAGHLGTSNYLFGDGHVKALKPSQTASPFNMWGAFLDTGSTSDCGATGWTTGAGYDNPNCDVPSSGAQGLLMLLEKRYN